ADYRLRAVADLDVVLSGVDGDCNLRRSARMCAGFGCGWLDGEQHCQRWWRGGEEHRIGAKGGCECGRDGAWIYADHGCSGWSAAGLVRDAVEAARIAQVVTPKNK